LASASQSWLKFLLATPPWMHTLCRSLPADDPVRLELHNEVHARPPARIRLPALITYVAVSNADVSREQECEHLRLLPGQRGLTPEQLQGSFLRLRLSGCTVKWERHTEFTRYSIVQPLPEEVGLGHHDPDLLRCLAVPGDWLASIPGHTFAAISMAMVIGSVEQSQQLLEFSAEWLGAQPVAASLMGHQGHSVVATDFRLRDDGFERILVIASSDTTEGRADRIVSRLLELETYRLMALRGLPVVKELTPSLACAERRLADITAQLEDKSASDQFLLDELVALAAGVERATAKHSYRFSATHAYHALVGQRIAELREQPIAGAQSIGDFMRRRLSPAMATVAAAERRLSFLSDRITRASALIRTRVDIAQEMQNQQLLAKLTKGQELQLRLQSTVEGLSIAAISYYVVSLLLYAAKAGKEAGLPILPELAAGALIPLVMLGVWFTVRRIHKKLHAEH